MTVSENGNVCCDMLGQCVDNQAVACAPSAVHRGVVDPGQLGNVFHGDE